MKEELKAYIKRVRNENGMTVKMFGDKVGKSPRTIQNFEQGRPVAPVLLAMIEKMYGKRK